MFVLPLQQTGVVLCGSEWIWAHPLSCYKASKNTTRRHKALKERNTIFVPDRAVACGIISKLAGRGGPRFKGYISDGLL